VRLRTSEFSKSLERMKSSIALFLIARLLVGGAMGAAAVAAKQSGMPYQRCQFFVRRFQQQAERLSQIAGAKEQPLLCLLAPRFMVRIDDGNKPLLMFECCQCVQRD
jgi:hypothetical protein